MLCATVGQKAAQLCLLSIKGLNSKLHAVHDNEGRPLILQLLEGQMRDHRR